MAVQQVSWQQFLPVPPEAENFSWQGTAIKQYIMPPTCVAWKLYIYTHRMNLFVD